MYCPKCGTQHSGNANFCIECGQQLQQDLNVGDQITVGNIINSLAVAIGRGASATVNLFRDSGEMRHQRNREAMLGLVKDFWIEGVYKQSLYQEILINLDIRESAELVENRPWKMVLQTPSELTKDILPEQSIYDVFTESKHSLLIAGEPGSGKTITLLELANDAIKMAEQDSIYPIPVVLNLSTWSENQPPLGRWIVDELVTRYSVPRKIATPWVENDELLLLLDGLDEVEQSLKNKCIEKLNEFRKTHFVQMVVCCRTAEYQELSTKLKLQQAVSIQPLTLTKVDQYLDQMLFDVSALREMIHTDPSMKELAQSPLMLNIMTIAYDELSQQDMVLDNNSLDSRRRHLFNTYAKKMFKRRSPVEPFSSNDTIKWLSWLGKELVKRSQTVFLVEQLQPNWLSQRSHQWSYVIQTRILLVFILFSLQITGYSINLYDIVLNAPFAQSNLNLIRIIAVVAPVIVLVLIGLGTAAVDIVRLERRKDSGQNHLSFFHFMGSYLGSTMWIFGLICVLIALVIFGTSMSFEAAFLGLLLSFLVMLLSGLIFGLNMWLVNGATAITSEIQIVEKIKIPIRRIFRGCLVRLGLALAVLAAGVVGIIIIMSLLTS